MLETMIIFRIFEGVREHFPVRRSEWVNSCVMAGWGAIVLFDDRPIPPSWTALQPVFHNDVAAWSLILLGFLRLIALTINGTFHQTWYGKYSPHVRVFLSIVCVLVWLQLLLALFHNPYLGTGIAAYLGYFVSDAMNALSASGDAKELDKVKRDAAVTAARTADTR